MPPSQPRGLPCRCDASRIDARLERLRTTRLYLVCDRAPGGRALTDVLAPALRGGVDIFQLRDKHASDDELLASAAVARELCAAAGALFILNDRPDLALRSEADGVHIGQDDGSIAGARAIVGADRIVGRSTHEPAQLAAADGADYVAAGPVHETPTKPGRAAAGIGYVRRAAADAVVPWFAIGGIDETNIGAVLDAGARRIVVVRAIAEAADPERAARALRDALDRRELRDAA